MASPGKKWLAYKGRANLAIPIPPVGDYSSTEVEVSLNYLDTSEGLRVEGRIIGLGSRLQGLLLAGRAKPSRLEFEGKTVKILFDEAGQFKEAD